MATKKKLLQAAAGSAGGAGPLNVEDVFSTYLFVGNGESSNIDNGINLGQSNDGGSAHFEPDDSNDTDEISLASANYITSGDFTIECFVWIEGLNSTNTNGYEIPTIFYFNSPRLSLTYDFVSPGGSADQAFNLFDTDYRFGSTNQHPEATYTNTWVHVAVVRNSGTIRCYVDGTEAFNFSNTTDYSGATLTIGNNSNGTPLQGHISNFRVVDGTAVYTSSFTPPTSELTAISGTTLLTFTSENTLTDTSSSSHAFTVTGSVSASNFGPFDAADAGEGGLVWLKSRGSNSSWRLVDTERGATYQIRSDETASSSQETGSVTSFNKNGFSVGSHAASNGSGREQATFSFRKAPKFFDVVTYTGNDLSGRTVSHNLGSIPGCILVKKTSGVSDWEVYHRGLDATSPENYDLHLNLADARQASASRWNNTAPTSTEFTVGASANVNELNSTYVAYLFAHNDGDGEFGPNGDADIIKCGSYTGNGSADGPTIDLGFEPQWVLIKSLDDGGHWLMFDIMRGTNQGTYSNIIRPNTFDTEASSANLWGIDILPNGFKINQIQAQYNSNTQNYIYIAIRRGPMAVPTDATKVFGMDPDGADGQGPTTNFVTDFGMLKEESANGSWYTTDRIRNTKFFYTNSTGAESTAGNTGFDRNNGAWDGPLATYFFWGWARAPHYFDVVAYTGTGSDLSLQHNLGVAPEMAWIKRRNAVGGWVVGFPALSNTAYGFLNDTDAFITSGGNAYFQNTTWSDQYLYLRTDQDINASGSTYVAYLFASVDGVSKLGSYTGNGSTSVINVDCGFSAGARFVLIKRTDSASGWFMFDTERGIYDNVTDDPYLLLNLSDAQVTATNYLTTYSSGFGISTYGGSPINASGGSYIFYAIA